MNSTLKSPTRTREQILSSVEQAISAIEQLKSEANLLFIEQASELMATAFHQGNKLIIAGNGGSLCDGAHFAEELTGIFRKKRKALPAIILSEQGHISCVANDLGYDWVFARGVEAFGKPGDVFVALTTSGNSKNILHACDKARELGMKVVSFLGKNGGKLKGKSDLEMVISGYETSDRIQEAHMTCIHIIIETIETLLFPELVHEHTALADKPLYALVNQKKA